MKWTPPTDGINVPKCSWSLIRAKGVHMSIKAIGIDLAKSVFSLYGIDQGASTLCLLFNRRIIVHDNCHPNPLS